MFMIQQKALIPVGLLVSFLAEGQSLFLPEMGKYSYSAEDVSREIINELPWVTVQTSKLKGHYKFLKKTSEFQKENWFQEDWYSLQDQFSLNPEVFIASEKAPSFVEAKRSQYKSFPFRKMALSYAKKLPSMKEWGGLTHPPVKNLNLPLERYHSGFGPLDYRALESPYFSENLQNKIDDLSQSELSFNNKVAALADHEAYLKKRELILKAKESILISTLVFVCDTTGTELSNILIAKKQQGLDIKIMVDKTISKLIGAQDCPRKLKQAGIEVIETRDFTKYKGLTIHHTKTMVIDSKIAVAGGMNIIDADHLSKMTNFMNRDVDLFIEGPLVLDVIKQFVENWNYQVKLKPSHQPLHELSDWIKKETLLQRQRGERGREYYRSILLDPDRRMKGVCRFIKQAPYSNPHSIGQTYVELLSHVKNSIVITDPLKSDGHRKYALEGLPIGWFDSYEMFNQLHDAVQTAAKKGITIDYLTTSLPMAGSENVPVLNKKIADDKEDEKILSANYSWLKLTASNYFFGRPHFRNLLKDWVPFENVHVWTHISFMHSKIFYFDRVLASVGSYNFNHSSTDQAYESTTLCMDESLNQQLDQILVQDMVNSLPLLKP